ncbi:hypothetical protein PIB30_009406 [Stylosanthes scabra]|uniref:PPM-type phosphatase domain-containing protein n=1 Tax=Stylosanthes scabra TaxID=79078 RepID=A0ABU6W8C0_9FABA|nr:hypothetical protein [Stylosanthes scabra]
MGSRVGKLCVCSSSAGSAAAGEISSRFDDGTAFVSDSHEKSLGDSICYVRPDNSQFSPAAAGNVFFRSVSGATVSANKSSTPSISLDDSLQQEKAMDSSASFESSGSFSSTTMTTTMVPLQLQQHPKSPFDETVVEKGYDYETANKKTCSRSSLKKRPNANARVSCSTNLTDELKLHSVVDDDGDDDDKCYLSASKGCKNFHWAHGRGGEDRLHIVICENHGWVYVGIYDGFNGPDATDYLLNNLFRAVYEELNKIMCQDCKKECGDVLEGLSAAMRRAEEAFLKRSDEMIGENPVLAMMGSCVLVMLMKGEDVYLMNVGDSRAVLATPNGNSLQLTMDHSTLVKEEVGRIWREHPDDPSAVTKGRVKGHLNVTRAFGVGFLKQPKQNNAMLETFKVKYIGESPYITCCPSLHHHRLTPNDKFLLLSSDGLFQYFTNQEALSKVEYFVAMFPDTDPAQLLIQEALNRAAKKAGMKLHELLDIPQGERRLYHDDISIVIISLEGKIWRS